MPSTAPATTDDRDSPARAASPTDPARRHGLLAFEAADAAVATAVTAWSSDPFAGGSYSVVGTSATPDDFAELGRAEGDRLFFAGEHTAFDHSATVNGAMVSGIRVAGEIDAR